VNNNEQRTTNKQVVTLVGRGGGWRMEGRRKVVGMEEGKGVEQ
jgi:hypothetical protein